MTIKKNQILKIAWLLYFIIVLNFNHLPGIQLISIISIVVLTLFCASKSLKKSNCYTGKWYFVFFVYMSLSLIWAVFKDMSSGVYEATFRVLVFSLCLDVFCNSKENTDYMLDVVVISGVFYALHVLLTTPVSAYGTLDVGISVNAQRNFVGQICALSSIVSFVLFTNEKTKLNKRLYFISMCLCYVVACISGSRKAFLMFPVAVIMYLFTQRSLNKKIRYFLFLIAVTLVFLAVFSQSPYLQEYFGQRLLALFDDSIADKSIDGRNYLKLVALMLFREHPVLGAGCDNVRSYLISIGYASQVYAHNNYLELLADYGIVGFCLYYYFHIVQLVKAYKYKWNNKYLRLIFVFIIAIMFMDYGQVSYQKHMYIYMLVVVCSSFKWMNRENIED